MRNSFWSGTLTLTLLFLGVGSLLAQQEMTLFHRRDLIQSDLPDPSRIGKKEWTISSPSVGFNFGHTGFAYNDLIKPTTGDSMKVDVDNAIAQMKDREHLFVNLHAYYFQASYLWNKNTRVGFYIADKTDLRFSYPKALPALIWKGNADHIGETLEIAPQLDATKYRDYALHLAKKIGSNWNLGVRISYYQGFANLMTRNEEFKVHTDTANYEISFRSNIQLNSYHPERFADPLPPYGARRTGNGAGIALGATYKEIEDLEISCSVNDLGFIHWGSDAEKWKSKGDHTFKGVDLKSVLRYDSINSEAYLDTLTDKLGFKKERGPYTSTFVPKIRAGIFYTHDRVNHLGFSYYQELIKYRYPSFTLEYHRDIEKPLGLPIRLAPGISYSYRNRSFYNLGASLVMGYKSWELFILGDNLASWFFPRAVIPFKELQPLFPKDAKGRITIPRNFRNYNLRVGLNYRF